MSGLSTLMALSVRRSMRSSSSPMTSMSSLAALAGSSGVRMVMYLEGEKTDGDATQDGTRRNEGNTAAVQDTNEHNIATSRGRGVVCCISN